MNIQRILIGCSVTCFLTGLSAASVTIVTDDTPVYQTGQIGPFTTTGSDMDGISVTVTYSGGATETATWMSTGANSGAAVGSGFEMSQSNNTFLVDWVLVNTGDTPIIGFALDTFDADKILDYVDPNPGTDGSNQGWGFDLTTGGDATASYSGAVILDGEAFAGDLFVELAVSLDSPLGGGSSLTFSQDVDNAPLGLSRIPFVPNPALPEPSSSLILGLLLSGACFMRRRK